MANYRQYTQCCDISNFDPGDPIANAALTGLYVTLAPGAFTLLLALAGAAGWERGRSFGRRAMWRAVSFRPAKSGSTPIQLDGCAWPAG